MLGASGIWSERDGNVRVKCAQMACDAAEQLRKEMHGQAVVGQFMADQIGMFVAMADGRSRVRVGRVSSHLVTVVEVMRCFGVNLSVDEIDDNSGDSMMTCEGKVVRLR